MVEMMEELASHCCWTGSPSRCLRVDLMLSLLAPGGSVSGFVGQYLPSVDVPGRCCIFYGKMGVLPYSLRIVLLRHPLAL